MQTVRSDFLANNIVKVMKYYLYMGWVYRYHVLLSVSISKISTYLITNNEFRYRKSKCHFEEIQDSFSNWMKEVSENYGTQRNILQI